MHSQREGPGYSAEYLQQTDRALGGAGDKICAQKQRSEKASWNKWDKSLTLNGFRSPQKSKSVCICACV